MRRYLRWLAFAVAVTLGGLLVSAQGQKQPAPAAQRSSVDALIGAAQYQDEVQGDPEAAIATYKKVLSTPRVTRAALAHLRIGLCYEKLGKVEARKEYDAVVREFGDQADIASQARARLAALTNRPTAAVSTEPMLRRLATGHSLADAIASPTGRHLAFEDDAGNLSVRELDTGRVRGPYRREHVPPEALWHGMVPGRLVAGWDATGVWVVPRFRSTGFRTARHACG
jgi:tetratricopeptide (TPR) repeat protein